VWTFWRGDEPIGTLHERARPQALQSGRSEQHVNAVLVPELARLPLPSVRQHVISSAGARVVIEHVRGPEIAGRSHQSSQEDEPAEVAFPVGERGHIPQPVVPPSRQLRVRDAAGTTVRTSYIAVLEYQIDPTSPPVDLASLPRGSLVNGKIWLVAFTQDSNAPAA